MKLIQNHVDILSKIKEHILKHHTTKDAPVEIINGEYYEGHSKQFQIKFVSFYTDKIGDIYLNFEIPDNNNYMLRFESITGIKTFSKKDNYKNLLNEIDSYIVYKKKKYNKNKA